VISQRGLTGYGLYKLAKLKRPDTLYRWLAGERGMNLDLFDQLCTALGLRLVESSKALRIAKEKERRKAQLIAERRARPKVHPPVEE
jgi:hypothetical protein